LIEFSEGCGEMGLCHTSFDKSLRSRIDDISTIEPVLTCW
jgi:hypothetical protein